MKNPPQSPFQILGDWRISRGLILLIIPHFQALELILSTGLRLTIKAEEAQKVQGGTLGHLLAQIEFGLDLPDIRFRYERAADLYPNWVFETPRPHVPKEVAEAPLPDPAPEPEPLKWTPIKSLPLPEGLDPNSDAGTGGRGGH